MHIGIKLIRLFGVFGIVALLSTVATASTLVPADASSTKIMVNSNAEADYVTLAKANASGISVNVFNNFSVSGKNLRFIHGGMQDSDYQPAKLIIIKSPSINIAGSLELVGTTADVLFIDSDTSVTSTISCSNCSFYNFGRIALAAATSENTVANGMADVGKLSTFSGGTVSINGLKTSGAYSLEVIAERLSAQGEIDTHIRGNTDSNGGYTVSAQGSKLIAVAGINLYLGSSAVYYEELNLAENSSSTTYNAEQIIGGTWKAAMINLISNRPVKLASSAEFSTKSDMLATNMHEGEFNTLLEGVYLQTTNESFGDIVLDGNISTDNLVQVLAQGDLRINSELNAHRADLFSSTGVHISTSAKVVAQTATIGAEWFTNKGMVNATGLSIETHSTLYNHFGGRLAGDVVTLVSTNGTVINGSRTNKLYEPSDLLAVHLDPEFKGNDKYGVYQSVNNESGATQSNVSGLITANEINIKAKRFENINPYEIAKPESETWSSGVPLDVEKSRRVAVLAESALKLDASEYVLNSSAIIGLNQAGSFDVNTPLLMNQRYRVEALLAVYSKETFDLGGATTTASRSNVNEIETYLTAYSPPGVFYSYGSLSFSDGIEGNAESSHFINQFSFVEILSDAHFHESKLHSLGLTMAARQLLGYEPVRCAVYGCAAATYLSLIESETLTSFGGNVYGISSELTVQTVNQLEDATKRAIVEAFVEQRRIEVEFEQTYHNPTGVGGDVYQRHYLSKWEVVSSGISEYIVITVNRCTRIEYYTGNISSTCLPYTEQYDLQAMLNEQAGDNLINGLPWTDNEVAAKAKTYIEGMGYSGSLELAGYSSIYGTYIREYVIYKISDDREYIQIDYVEKFQPNNAASLEEAQSRAAAYYRKAGSVILRLEELMGSVVPDVPTDLNLTYSLTDGQVTYNLSWTPIDQSNITYHLLTGGSTTGTTHTISRSVSPGNTSFSIKVKACNSVTCGEWSNSATVEFQVRPSEADLANCRSTFYSRFNGQFKIPFVGGYGNYCGITTRDGTDYYVIAEQRLAEDPGNNIYARCERVKYFNRDAIETAILDETTLPSVSFTEGSSGYYVDCKDYVSFSLYAL